MAQFRQATGGQLSSANKWALVLGVTILAGFARAAAAGTEVREFTIHVDNKKAGSYQLTLQDQDNGVVIMNGKADLTVRYLVSKYTYSYVGREVWSGTRLQSFRSTTNDDGNRFEVSAVPAGNSLRVTANGQARLVRPDIWLTSYWRLPEARFRNQAVPLVDGDTGKDINARLQFIAMERVQAAGQAQNCAHYRVTGGPAPVDLWYDSEERLVRESFVEQRHQTVIHLAGIRR